ncbi:MAG: lysine--tRNA ligase [Mycoplasma sp.]
MSRKFSEQELIRRDTLKKLQEANKNPFEIERVNRTLTLEEFNLKYKDFSKEELATTEQPIEVLCGRIMSNRQTFYNIKDFSGKSQIYINKKKVPEVFEETKNLDIGDIAEIHGKPMKTMTGEVTLDVSNLIIVSKSLKVLPEKFHGLQNEELRSRHRYVDLIVNDDSMKTFIIRSKIISLMRQYLDSLGYLEVETPVLQPILGGANARPFTTHHNALDRDFYLRIATELPLKKLIVGGFEKVYEIGRIFRNEGMDATHNPEFTSIEAYTAYVGMEETMDIVENIIKNISEKLDIYSATYRGHEIDLKAPFKRIHMVDFIKQETGVDFWPIHDHAEAIAIAKKHNIHLEKHQHTVGHVINKFYEEFCESKCIQPTFVHGHPTDVSPLSKIDYSDLRFTKRFELFIGEKEFANAFAELNDPIDQFNRFEEQLKEKDLGNDEANEMDIDFIEALEYGLPPTGGLGIGIDRLVMLFTNNDTIRDVLLFPHMKDSNKQ